jgi:hypothetical protein
MKKVLAVGLITLVALAPAAVAGGKKQQKVEGTILAAPRHPDGCYSGVHRRIQSITDNSANGVVGYDFDVAKSTWKKPFVLKLADGVGTVDLDITYYLGDRFTLDDMIAGGGDPAPPASIAFEDRKEGGEKGKVPFGSVYAIVCIYESENGVGGNATFNYVAGKGAK